jgi:basic membrane lipoprotein Med (substrate-binding protein (PBP1-ABC) superfamily)
MKAWLTSGVALLCATLASHAHAQDCQQQNETRTKVAFVYKGDRSADEARPHERARAALSKEFSSTLCTIAVDQLVEGVDPDANARYLLGSLALEGYSTVFVVTSDYQDQLAKVAPQFPKTRFVQLDGARANANRGAYSIRSSEAAFLAGMISAAATPNRVVGLLIDRSDARERLDAKAFLDGAHAIRKNTTTRVAHINVNSKDAEVTRAAHKLASQGATVLFIPRESGILIDVASKMGVRAVQWGGERQAKDADVILARVGIDWPEYYRRQLAGTRTGPGAASLDSVGVKEGLVGVLELSDLLTAQQRKLVRERESEYQARPAQEHLRAGSDKAGTVVAHNH